jgi:uncharacterized protein YodC (DUF2158 family)
MNSYQIGDLVVLTAGSMRMAVESVEGDMVACVWCHEGIIGRDSFDARLLKKWEVREDSGAGARPFRGDREGGGRSFGGDREGGGRPWANKGRPGGAGGPRDDDRPKQKTGWDGKPREKKFFRKDA